MAASSVFSSRIIHYENAVSDKNTGYKQLVIRIQGIIYEKISFHAYIIVVEDKEIQGTFPISGMCTHPDMRRHSRIRMEETVSGC